MATPVVESSAGTFLNNQTITITKPTGTAEGDLLFAVLGMADEGLSYATPSGWTLETTYSAQNMRLQTFEKVAGASEPASYSFTTALEFNDKVGAIVRISGQKATAPVDVSGNSNGSSTSPVAPAVTASESTDLLRLRAALSYSPEINMTTGEIINVGDNIRISIAEDAATTGPSIPTRAFDTFTFSDQWVTQTTVILPAADDQPQTAIMMGANF